MPILPMLTSVYLPEAAYEALRQVAFDERRKIHDLLMEGVELALKKHGYPALAEMKAKSLRLQTRYTALAPDRFKAFWRD